MCYPIFKLLVALCMTLGMQKDDKIIFVRGLLVKRRYAKKRLSKDGVRRVVLNG